MASSDPPLALYVHVPWCEKKCPYCDFNSHAVKAAVPERAYVEALMADLDRALPDALDRELHSIFIGGGTPSLFDPGSVASIVAGVRSRMKVPTSLETTLEANPGSSDAVKFAEFRAAGINRLSIGVQSFDDASLRRIGRIHGGADARRAVEAAGAAGFDNFNLDLMYALPGQSRAAAAADVDMALSFEAPHLSFYQLTVEPNTVFAARTPELPDEDAAWAMQRHTERRLLGAGYANYEVSAFARAGRSCRHNLNYWQFGDYIGIGAGAHGKLTRGIEIKRTWKWKNPLRYMHAARSGERVGGENRLSAEDVALEFMMNALRLNQPLELSLFRQRTGQSADLIRHALKTSQADGLLRLDGDRVWTTDRGRRFLDDLLQRFLPQPARVRHANPTA